MRVEYGPPGHKGVTQIMGLGATGPVASSIAVLPQDKSGRTVGLLAAAVWVAGAFIGSNTAKNVGLGALGAVIAVQVLKNRSVTVVEVPTPTTTQGWG